MSGIVTPFVDYNNSTDSGENNTASIAPILNGEALDQTVLQRADENLRLRTEALRTLGADALFLQNADRSLIIAGPGKVTWPGSTTVAATGIPVLSDVLWILPMLTPGFAQTAPVPPVASKYGTLHLKRVTGSLDSILVTSQRRSYAAGDQINITVSAGGAFSCVLQTEITGAYRRTIKIVATGATTLSTVISALNALTPPAPDNTALVTAALEGGAVNGDLFLTAQARQFVSGNFDGEGHTITPANLASYYASNPTHALAEGDTLCVQFAMLSDTASTGGRRQAIPENTNTPITAGMFFNSRVQPEKLVNALPICKVVDGALVFGTGVAIAAGGTTLPINYTLPDRITLGALSLGSAANARLPRLTTNYSGTHPITQLWTSARDSGSGPGVRVYASASGELSVVVNASFDGTNWSKDVVGTAATMAVYRPATIEMYSRPATTAGTWVNWAYTTVFTGAEATTLANPAFASMLQLFDASGNRRVGFDHLGYVRKQLFQVHQNWITPMYAAWTAAVTGGASNTPEVGFNGNMPGVWLRQTVVANTEIARLHSPSLISGATYDSMIAVMEFSLETTDLAGTPTLTYQIGFIHDEAVEPSTEDFVKIYKTAANANWFFKTYGSTAAAGTDVNTGVTATGLQRFRIELHGTNSPGGKRALLWINGALVGTSTTNLPDQQEMKLSSFFRSDGATTKNVYVSAINFSLNRTLADDPV